MELMTQPGATLAPTIDCFTRYVRTDLHYPLANSHFIISIYEVVLILFASYFSLNQMLFLWYCFKILFTFYYCQRFLFYFLRAYISPFSSFLIYLLSHTHTRTHTHTHTITPHTQTWIGADGWIDCWNASERLWKNQRIRGRRSLRTIVARSWKI